MRTGTSTALLALITASTGLLPLQAWAIRDAIPVDTTTVIQHPYAPQKVVEAWKLVGGGSCSNIRITKEWIMASGHCGYGSGGGTFSNEFGSASVEGSTCANPVADFGYATDADGYLINDFQLCRLVNTGSLSEPASYPALAVMPSFSTANAGRLGALLVRGMAKFPWDPNQVGLVDLNGVPLGTDPTTLDLTRNLPYVVSGDSGGGAYWLPPSGQDPVLVGIVSQMKPGGLPNVPWFFTATNLHAIVNYIQTRGKASDQIPAIKTTADAYFVPNGPASSPSMMSARPTLRLSSASSNTGITASWTAPTSVVTIDRYRVTLAQDGSLAQTQWIAAGQALSVSFSGLKTSGNSRVCITPSSDSAGLATAVYATRQPDALGPTARGVLPGCTDFDNRVPSTVTNLAGSVVSRTSATANISMSWSPQDSITKSYRVTQTTIFPSGPKRVVTKDVASTSVTTNVAKGATLCTQVTSLSELKVVGTQSGSVCVISN